MSDSHGDFVGSRAIRSLMSARSTSKGRERFGSNESSENPILIDCDWLDNSIATRSQNYQLRYCADSGTTCFNTYLAPVSHSNHANCALPTSSSAHPAHQHSIILVPMARAVLPGDTCPAAPPPSFSCRTRGTDNLNMIFSVRFTGSWCVVLGFNFYFKFIL